MKIVEVTCLRASLIMQYGGPGLVRKRIEVVGVRELQLVQSHHTNVSLKM